MFDIAASLRLLHQRRANEGPDLQGTALHHTPLLHSMQRIGEEVKRVVVNGCFCA